jgi:DNA-binding transcriptional LysR family regulator
MELRQLEHFVAIAEEQSFTRAARRLSYVQSALSVSIQALERELGVRLFDRTTHRVVLTDVGAAVLSIATRTLASVDEVRDTADAFQGVIRGTLRIGLMQTFTFVDVPALLGRFHEDHPSVDIQIRPSVGGSAALVEDVRQGAADIAFASLPDDLSGLAVTPLGEEELLLVGRTDRLPAGRGPIKLQAIGADRFLDFPVGWGVRAVIDHAFADAGLERGIVVEVADTATLVRLVAAGLGMAILPRSLVPEDLSLRTRRLTPTLSWRAVMVLPARRPASTAARALAEIVIDSTHQGGRRPTAPMVVTASTSRPAKT